MIDSRMEKILQEHDHIFVRESLTEVALRTHNITQTTRSPDPAFFLPPEPVPVPEGFLGLVAAVNLSPLMLRRFEHLMNDFVETAHFLLRKIDTLLLLPHVTMPADDDREALEELAQSLSSEERSRICRVPESANAAQRKYLISRCELLVCCRTHASIAAYSTGVPTLVVGYSVKSKGIGLDLGMERWVISAEDSAKLPKRVAELWENRRQICTRLLEKQRELHHGLGNLSPCL